MYHLVVRPDTDLHGLLGRVWNEVDLDFFVEFHSGNLDGMVEQRDTSVAIDDSGLAQAEDVLGRSVRFGQAEWAKQAIAFLLGSMEAHTGNLLGRGMDLVIVVTVDFLLEDGTNLFDPDDVLQSTGAHDAILQPLVRPLDLAFGLGR